MSKGTEGKPVRKPKAERPSTERKRKPKAKESAAPQEQPKAPSKSENFLARLQAERTSEKTWVERYAPNRVGGEADPVNWVKRVEVQRGQPGRLGPSLGRVGQLYTIQAKDNTGRQAWYIIDVPNSKAPMFPAALSRGALDLTDWGRILDSGYGESVPPEVLKRYGG